MSVSWSLDPLAPAPCSCPWLLVADAIVAESFFAEDSARPKPVGPKERLSSRLLLPHTCAWAEVRREKSFCASHRCDSIKNAEALQ